MATYTGLFFLIGILYIVFQKRKGTYIFICIFMIFLLFSLRDFSVGTDTENYIRIYETQTILRVNHLIERFPDISLLLGDYLYFIYSWVLLHLGITARGFIVVTALVMLIPVFFLLKKYSRHPLVSIFSFMTIGQMTLLMSAFRQGLAIAISIFALKYLIEKKTIKFFLIVLVAAGVHVTVLIMLPAYFLIIFFQNKKPEASMIIFTVSGILGSGALIIVLSKLNLGVRFGSYIENNVVKTNPLVLVMYLLLAFIYVALRKFNKIYIKNKESNDDRIIFVMFCIGIGILALSLQNTIISRFSYYFLTGLPIIVDRIVDMQYNQKIRAVTILICLFIEISYFYYTIPGSYLGVADYTFFWQ